MTEEEFLRELRRLIPELSSAALEKLLLYADLLQEMAHPLGLIGTSERQKVLAQHLLDSLALVPHLPSSGRLADLGSGAGLPGMVVKIARPELEVWLIEPRRKAVSFLEYAMARLGLPKVRVLRARAEDSRVPRHHFEVVTARALAELPQLWSLAEPLLRPGGRLWAFKARNKLPLEMDRLRKRFPQAQIRLHPYRVPEREKGVFVEIIKQGVK